MSEETSTKRNRTIWIVVIVVALLLLCVCAVLAIAGATMFTRPIERLSTEGIMERVERAQVAEVTVQREETIQDLETPVRVTISNRVGEVHVMAADGDDLYVEATIKAWDSPRYSAEETIDRVTFDVYEARDGSDVVIEAGAEQGINWNRTPVVDLTIHVPQPCRLEVKVDVGEVTLSDIEGVVDVTTNVGALSVENLMMVDDCSLRTDVGEVSVSLPDEISFALDASSNVGEVDCEFSLRNERAERQVVRERVRGDVGDDPVGELTIRVQTGAVRVERY